ncbi:VWA domain-containing protein [Anaerolineales bacterium]
MSGQADPYTLLGLQHNASQQDIKNAYRKLVQRLHPDRNKSPGARALFEAVTRAHELLSNVHAKEMFDSQIKSIPADAYFSLRVTPSRRAIQPLGETQVLYLLAEIEPPPQLRTMDLKQNTPVNLTLVLDQSNSMKGARLELVKIAVHKIIDSLNENDILSVVSFNDRPKVVIAPVAITESAKASLKAQVSLIQPIGATQIFKALNEGYQQNQIRMTAQHVNHIILLTDGHTYGDPERSYELAEELNTKGIGISTIGLGTDWNEDFLDKLASKTGGQCEYIENPKQIIPFLNNQIRHLSDAYADNLELIIAPDPDVLIDMTFKLSPHPQPLAHDSEQIALGTLQTQYPSSVLLQLQIPPNQPTGFITLGRLLVSGNILHGGRYPYQIGSDITIEVTHNPVREDPPPIIMDALSKLTLYRLQEKAKEALDRGDVAEATRRLENLATRFQEMGQTELATRTLAEAQRVAHTSTLSNKGRKTLMFQTRTLMVDPKHTSNLINDDSE